MLANPLAAGWDALGEGDWQGARACFEQALAAAETPEAFEGLSWAAYCLDDEQLTFDSRERAYRLFRQRGDASSAARVAAWLATDSLDFRGEPAVANGWLERARRLLEGVGSGSGQGWLALHEAAIVLDEDPEAARRLAAHSVEVGRALGVPELEMVGLGVEGAALVSEGDLEGGMRRLDEATAAALAGETQNLVCVGWACCYLIGACEQVRDYDRAGQWCVRVGEFCERHGISSLLNVCRAKYAAVLTWQGRWAEAEDELTSATAGLAASRSAMVGEALLRLAELRRRQGRPDEAEELYARCEGYAGALLGHAALAFDRGQAEEAAELADRYLRRFPESARMQRCAGLEIAVRAHARLGDHGRAVEALGQLQELAARVGTRPLQAAALAAQGTVAAAHGDPDTARVAFEDALDHFTVSGAPFEISLVRLELAATLAALGRDKAARREAEMALAAFKELGASRETARAESMLRRLHGMPPPLPDGPLQGPLTELTRRQLEVLALVTEGLTNRQIAERLVISEHTVHRHVNAILRELGAPSRAAAASLAVRHGLA